MAARYALARRKATELLEAGKVIGPAVDVDRLARLAGAVVRRVPFEGRQLSGILHRQTNGPAIIGVNTSHPPARIRFTIAHELGHLILHAHKDFHMDESFPVFMRNERSSTAEDDLEIEANQFAAELLMPASMLRSDMEDGRMLVDFESGAAESLIRELAARYEVSVPALTFRLTNLNLLR